MSAAPNNPLKPDPPLPEQEPHEPNPSQLPIEPEFGPMLPPAEPEDPTVKAPHL